MIYPGNYFITVPKIIRLVHKTEFRLGWGEFYINDNESSYIDVSRDLSNQGLQGVITFSWYDSSHYNPYHYKLLSKKKFNKLVKLIQSFGQINISTNREEIGEQWEIYDNLIIVSNGIMRTITTILNL